MLPFGSDGYLDLIPGAHLITFNEIVNLPLHVMALGRPRSSLLRAGVAIHTAVWDAGYRGRSQALLVVYNHHGYRLGKDAQIEHEEVVAGILREIVRIRLAGQEDRARIG